MTDVARRPAGTRPPTYLDSLNSQGGCYQNFGRYAEAEALHYRIIDELQGREDDELNELSHYNLMLAIASTSS